MEPSDSQYLGLPGVTHECVVAVTQVLQAGERIASARILTKGKGRTKEHCLLLKTQHEDSIFVRSGFSSGYGGEGPNGLSFVLALLMSFDIEFDEIEVDASVQKRVDAGCVSDQVLEAIEKQRPLRPSRAFDYISEDDFEAMKNGTLWTRLDPIIPLAIVDPRLVDIVRDFWLSPDQKLFMAFRRLEEDTRQQLMTTGAGDPGADVVGQDLFRRAFAGDSPALSWKRISRGEHEGRWQLFASVYKAYRNRRAHKEVMWEEQQELLRELLLVNHLFGLLREATPGTGFPPKTSGRSA